MRAGPHIEWQIRECQRAARTCRESAAKLREQADQFDARAAEADAAATRWASGTDLAVKPETTKEKRK